MAIILFSILVHIGLKLEFRNLKKYKDVSKNELNLKITINGGFAFFSFAPLVTTLLFLFTMIIIYHVDNKTAFSIILTIPMLVLCGFLMFWYLPSTLSYIQPDTLGRNVKKAIIEVYSTIFMAFVVIAWLLYKF